MKRRGFSLIQVLVTVLIAAILLGVAIPQYTSAQAYAKRKACEDNLSAIYQAEQTYRTRNRTYTTTLNNLSADLGGAAPTCPLGGNAYVITTSGSGASLSVTIRCDNTGAHISGQKLTTTDGVTFVGVTP